MEGIAHANPGKSNLYLKKKLALSN